MSVFNCEQHGIVGVVLACPHIRQDIDDRKKSKKIIKAEFPDGNEIEEKYRYKIILHYCSVCAAELDYPRENSEMPREKLGSMYDGELFCPACWKCLIELNEQK